MIMTQLTRWLIQKAWQSFWLTLTTQVTRLTLTKRWSLSNAPKSVSMQMKKRSGHHPIREKFGLASLIIW
ncbi:hypothetical protein [Pseudomonas sp. MWU13-2517]|uniref:hypothetical protein n=1 Tax=Pseudomonas sp. MWU13-2517 TaxID=2929055 RepID=UPI002010805E|nr:hypothetical protein [Pseudomonas sp. MWU13-2517]